MGIVNYEAERTDLAAADPDTDYPGVTLLDPLAINVDGTGGTIRNKPVLTLEQVTDVINRTSYPGTDIGGPGWDQGEYGAQTKSETPGVVSFAFQTAATMFAPPYVYVSPTTGRLTGRTEYFGFQEFSDAQKASARESMGMWDEIVAYTFLETSVANADVTFGNYTNQPGTQAYAYLPYEYGGISSGLQGDVWVNGNEASNLQLGFGDYGPITLIHEIGHAIGLQHPGAYNAAPGVSFTYANNAEYYQDSRQYTVMSYFNAENTGAAPIDWSRLQFVYAQTPLVHDIATAQAIYGTDTTTRTGDTVYGFNSTADREVFDFTKNDMPVLTIWDAGGIDTIDFSGWNTNSTINLAPGSFSSGGGSGVVPLETLKAQGLLPPSYTEAQYTAFRLRYNALDGLLHDNISIAYGATIENATGGGGDDVLLGNTVGNVLKGNAGNDTLRGLGGDDTLIGGVGNDMLDGGEGVDTVDFADGPQGVTINLARGTVTGAAGTDTLVSIENVRASRGDDIITGNAGANRVKGETGNDRIDGGAGDDILFGDGGDDTIIGGLGDDDLAGGVGIDTVDFYATGAAVTVDLSDTKAQNTGAGLDRITGFENLRGSTMGDTLTGSAAANRIKGEAGNDRIFGLGGDDTLFGDGGDDVLNGGTGYDVLAGGAGVDRFVFDSLNGDLVADWTAGEKIDVSTLGVDGVNIVTRFGKATVSFDLDGDGQFDDGFFTVSVGSQSFTANDLVLI
ncbi:MAG TPA: M10 family metallopeptidase C-terminal domain-containing protein [Sphingomonas sp.]|uniref:M10 family metallopeptidase C-terminal domain-containing protein n=1 Tax=Sphingomonas sp. TaxID=28214 RepID=UPI002ED98FEF